MEDVEERVAELVVCVVELVGCAVELKGCAVELGASKQLLSYSLQINRQVSRCSFIIRPSNLRDVFLCRVPKTAPMMMPITMSSMMTTASSIILRLAYHLFGSL